jgi:hypothetical protein
LEQEFGAACDAAVAEARLLGYDPTVWISMQNEMGAAEAARRLLASGDIQSGFLRLVEFQRPDLTVEWSVLDPKWEPLFTEDHRHAARWRLRQAGVTPPT